MHIPSEEIKKHLEENYSMPFDVQSSEASDEMHYRCSPSNKYDEFFDINFYIHDNIRLIFDISPQRHGGVVLNEIAHCTAEKQAIFFEYKNMLETMGAKVNFNVNNIELNPNAPWPDLWKLFSARITLAPIPEENQLEFVYEWLYHSFDLIFSLLTIIDKLNDIDDQEVRQTEGTVKEMYTHRYERNSINRKLCLFKKGYNCAVCGMNFYDLYGEIGKNFIEVHHTTPVSIMGKGYQLDIDRDLVPLCSNCHSMAHRRNPPYTIEELKKIIKSKTII